MAEGNEPRPFDLDKVNPKTLSSIDAYASDNFTITSNSRLVVFALDSNGDKCGAWFIYAYSGGSVGYKEIVKANALTLTGGTNTLTIAKSVSGQITYLVFELNNSKMDIAS